MVNRDDASVEMHLATAFEELEILKWNIGLIKLAMDCEDVDSIHLLLDCFEPRFNLQIEEIHYALKKAQTETTKLLNEAE